MIYYYKLAMKYPSKEIINKSDANKLINYILAPPQHKIYYEKDFIKICLKAEWLYIHSTHKGKIKRKTTYELVKSVFKESLFQNIINRLLVFSTNWLHENNYHYDLHTKCEIGGFIGYECEEKYNEEL